MRVILSPYTSSYQNLALEEILLKDATIKDDILLIYQNANAIIIGRNQNAHEEINDAFVKAHQIEVIRRISGGGSVYHDMGNVNFSFITSHQAQSFIKFLDPIIVFLKTLGLNAELRGKNDLTIDGFKVSGNAQYIYKDRMFHHGTLLFDANLSMLSAALQVNPLKLASKAIKSKHASVKTIKSLMPEPISTPQFVDRLINFFVETYQGELMSVDHYKLNEVHQLASVRKSYDWNYVKNPPFNYQNEQRFDGGTIKVLLEVSQNKLIHIAFYGDFLSANDFENIESYFLGINYDSDSLAKAIFQINNFETYFGKITRDEILQLIMPS